MKTKALRLYGKNDLRLEEFDLPPITESELLVKIISQSICMSDHKGALLGAEHKRVPDNVAENPIILGHEFCGETIEVGNKYKSRYSPGQKFVLQPAMKGTYSAAGYTFPHLGGNSNYGIIPECYIEQDCVLVYEGDGYFGGSMAEPISCIIGAAHANYHTVQGEYVHYMGIKKSGKLAALGACGPMGLAFIEYLIHRELKPSLIVVTDIDDERLKRAAELLPSELAAKHGIRLIYENTGKSSNPTELLRGYADGGYDDVFVYVPVVDLVEQGGEILGYDGCLNFFAGPTDTNFSAKFNFYDVHYNATHIVGTSGGNTSDMQEALDMSAAGKLNPAILISHIGGLDAAAYATLNLPKIPGAKKLIYTEISMPLTAISDFRELGAENPVFKALADICDRHNGLWSVEAERYLLSNYTK